MRRLTRQCSGIRRRLQGLVANSNPHSSPRARDRGDVALALAAPVAAQDPRGTITGTIRDASGSVIQGDRHHHQQGDGHHRPIVTNEVGFYQAPISFPESIR